MSISEGAAELRAQREEAAMREFDQQNNPEARGEAELDYGDALPAAGRLVDAMEGTGLSVEAGALQLAIAESAHRNEAGFASLEQAIGQLEHLHTAARSQQANPEALRLMDQLWAALYREKAVRLPEHTLAESVAAAQAATGTPALTDARPGDTLSADHQLEAAQASYAIAAATEQLGAEAATSQAVADAQKVWGDTGVLSGPSAELNYFDADVQNTLRRDILDAFNAKLAAVPEGQKITDQATNLFSGAQLETIARLMSTFGAPVTPELAGQASIETIAHTVGLELPEDYRAKLQRNDTTDGYALAA